MLDEKSVERLVKLLDDKKIKKGLNKSDKMFDKFKGLLGASNIERMKLPMEFENNKDYIQYIREYIKKHSNDITEYSNKILMLNEKVITSESEDDVLELFGILMGFSAFLMIKGLTL